MPGRGTKAASGAAFAVLLLGLLLPACGTPESFEGARAAEANGEILFVADGNIMRWSDGKIEQLTEGVWAASPTWAPAGDRFAYVQRHEDFSEVVIANRQGEPLLQLTSHDSGFEEYTEEHVFYAAWARDPDWSPVGEELVYVSDKGGLDIFSRKMYVWLSEFGVDAPPYQLDASNRLALSQEGPVYSPDGSRLAFSARQELGAGVRRMEVWTLDLDTGFYEPLVVDTEGAFNPDWSADGEHIAYIQRNGEHLDVWVAPIDGSEPYQLTEFGKCAAPVWSPDGTQIAFIRAMGVEFEVWVVDVETGEDGRLTAANPRKLFGVDDIEPDSGLSWFARN